MSPGVTGRRFACWEVEGMAWERAGPCRFPRTERCPSFAGGYHGYMILSMTMIQRWQRILDKDNGPKAVDLARGARVQERDALLAMALSQDKLPSNVLVGLNQAGAFDARWIGRASTMDRKHLLRALIWRAGQVSEDQWQHEMSLGYGMAMGAYVYHRRDPWDTTQRLAHHVIALLDTWPELVHQDVVGKPVPREKLFELAIARRESDWLTRSGLAEEVLHAAIRKDRHTALIALIFPQEGEAPLESFNAWMETHPALKAAWDRLAERDRHEMEVLRDWCRQWIPNGWDKSPLQEWCNRASNEDISAIAGTPLDHPHFNFPWDQVGMPNFRGLACLWASRMAYSANNLCHVLDLNHTVRRSMGNDAYDMDLWITEGPLSVPLDPVVAGLAYQEDWVSEVMLTSQGAHHIQGLLEDERVQFKLGETKPATVAEWVAQNPAWHEWRDRKGKSLLDIRAQEEPEGWGRAKLSKGAAMRLAKKVPHLLLHQNAQGQRTLDGFDMAPDHRAAVYRHLLGQHAEPSTKHRATPRAM